LLFVIAAFDLRFSQSAWLVGGYFCFFWAMYFHALVQPSKALWKRGLAYSLFTAFIGIPVLLIWRGTPVFQFLYSGAQSQSFLLRVFGFICGVGVLEETCKASPLLRFSLGRERLSIRDGVFLGMMSGLGFALAEVVGYSVRYWQESASFSAAVIAKAASDSDRWLGGINSAQFSAKLNEIVPQLGDYYGSVLTIQLVRFIPLPLLHAAWSGTAGWFIAVASTRNPRWPTIYVGIAFMAVLHGAYDALADSVFGVLLAAVSIAVLLFYLRRSDERTTQPIA